MTSLRRNGQHGKRGTEWRDALVGRVFGHSPHRAWLDALRVSDLAVMSLDVAPRGALRFRQALTGAMPGERVQVESIPGMGQTNADQARWWPACLTWLTA